MLDIPAIETLLRDRRQAVTTQRRTILQLLSGRKDHPTAGELVEALEAAHPGVASRATVYNTLALLKDLGVVTELPDARGESRWDPNPQPHHHRRCVQCGSLEDVPAHGVRVGHSGLGGFQVRSAKVVFEGLCAGCAEEPRSA